MQAAQFCSGISSFNFSYNEKIFILLKQNLLRWCTLRSQVSFSDLVRGDTELSVMPALHCGVARGGGCHALRQAPP